MSVNYTPEVALINSTVGSVDQLFTHRDNMDALMHERFVDQVRQVIAAFPGARWLTIGDEGTDGWMLRQRGARHVTASSLSDARLRKAVELGHLKDIPVLALNAEHLELADESFDLTLCCQAYHHVRRAPLAFYEFARVSRIGFTLVEPIEYPRRPLDAARTAAKILLRRRTPIYDLFEQSGNFIYRLSEREIFRMAAAIQLPWYAIKSLNGFFLQWLAAQPRDSRLARALFDLGVGVQDALSACHLMSPGLCVVFVALGPGAEPARELLRADGFRVVPIPKNPYIHGEPAHDR